MFAFHSYICQGNSLFFDIYGFLGLFLIGTCLNGFLCICRSCFCKRCCFVSDLYNGCCCLVLCNYGCLCCGCCCQCNRCNNCFCLSGAAFLCITSTPGLTFSTCRCSGCRCRSQTLDRLIQLSACLIQAVQNLLQSIFCILLFCSATVSFPSSSSRAPRLLVLSLFRASISFFSSSTLPCAATTSFCASCASFNSF